MKDIRWGILVALFSLLSFAWFSTAFAEKKVTILYSGCTYGRIYPVEG